MPGQFNAFDDLPDLRGKVFIVTGSNRGIGYTTAKHFYYHNAKVYLAVRDETKATEAIEKIQSDSERQAYFKKSKNSKPSEAHGELAWLPLDLSDPRKAKEGAEKFMEMEKRLDVLVNNAFSGLLPYEIGPDGVVNIMMINVFSTFMFTMTLLPLLTKTSQEPNSDVRIVNVGSESHRMTRGADPNIHFKNIDDFNKEYKGERWPNFRRYCVSKLANLLWTSKLQKRLSGDQSSKDIICITPHPGMVDTFSERLPLQPISKWMFKAFVTQPDEGSFTTCFAAAAPQVRKELDKYRGKYLGPVAKLQEPSKNAKREDLEDEVWDTVENFLTGLGLYP